MKRRLMILAALLALGAVLPAQASTFLARSEKELVAASDAVVRGRVVSVESFWNDPHTLIISEAVFEVESAIVGTTPRYVTLRTAGGTVDGYTVEAIGFPAFRAGDRALLFLERDDEKPLGRVYTKGRPESYRVAGYQLGHYRIVNDRGEGEIAVPTADPGLRVLRKDGRPAAPPRVRRLPAFEEEIRQIGQRLGRDTETAGRSQRR
jgi:hypothetical protein